ncbi:MAG: lysophospholipid acyltransferase family protein [Legionellaceae bacterium]|nr:lysophospholipid acyltransferase family protein [Legionellaceae bacterium]
MTKIKSSAHKNKAGLFRTLWVAFASLYYIFATCSRAVLRSYFGKTTRAWVDARMQLWAKQTLSLWNISCSVHNPKNVHPKPGQPTIIMCNHSSLFDIPLTYHAFPKTSLRMLAKKEMSRYPIMGRGMRASEFPFVDRKNRRQAIQDLEYIHGLLESGIVMWIAPEGTRAMDGRVGPFKKGGFITAIQTKATIIPIGVRGAFDIIPAKTYDFYLNQTGEVHIGEPIDASQFSLDNKEELIELTRKSIKKLAGDDKP